MHYKFLRTLGRSLAIGAIGLAASFGANATDAADEPLILDLRSNIYGYIGPTNSFTIYFGSTEKDVELYVVGPKTEEYVTVNPYSIGTGSDGSHEVIATAVTLSVTETDNQIKVYGDASKIDFIDVHGCYLSSADFPGNFVNLSVVDLSHNELTSIDLSGISSLESIDLTDNAFSVASQMNIGTNHPDLQILQVGINEVCDPNLDLRNFPNLQYFSARNNYGITTVDPSNCPNLVSLVLEVTNISSLDVSKNTNLDVLNISNTRITSIDLSNNKNLGEFYWSHEGSYNNGDQYKISQIDLSNNTKLQYLDLAGNKLTSIDVSMCPNLLLLYLQRNLLSSIDLSKNKRLATVNLANNLFTFANLPLPQEGWDYVYYRGPLPTDAKYKVGEPIDFSAEVIRAPYQDAQGNTITPETYANVFVAPKAKDTYELDASKYTYSNGVVTINQAISDPVYVEFFCTAFPDWPMNSAEFIVKTPEEFDLPATVFSFTPDYSLGGQTISFKMGAVSTHSSTTLPADVSVIINGETTVLKNAVTSAMLPQSNNITITLPSNVSRVQIALPDGLSLSALDMNGIKLSNIDLTPAEELTILKLDGCGLYSIDLGYNRLLELLDLSNNELSYLSLNGVRGDYEKWYLAEVKAPNNHLNSLNMVAYDTVQVLDLSGNAFTEFDFKYYEGLVNVNLSNNQILGTVDLTPSSKLVSVDLSNNQISELIQNWRPSVQNVHLENNNLTFATLPKLSAANYTYAPQAKMKVLSSASAINLEAQSLNGNTKYVWKYAESGEVVPASEYTFNNGATQFNESLIGKTVYCEMTSSIFPAFDSTPLTTTNVTVADKPTNLVASFTTTQDGTATIGFSFHNSGENAVYIDWRGDGSEYEPYIYAAGDTGGIYRTGTCYAGKTAKVYAMESPEEISVFAMLNTPLSDFDGTPMTKVTAIDIHNAGLTDDAVKFPDSPGLYELVLDGNNFSKATFQKYPNLSTLNLGGNQYTEFDVSLYPEIFFLQLADNKIASVKFGNNNFLYQLDMTNNQLTDIDLSNLSGLRELLLTSNRLPSIDITPVKDQLTTLYIAGNCMTFANLPTSQDFGQQLTAYSYANQQPITVTCDAGKVDLTDQAEVNGTATTYRWFLGDKQSDVYYDAYYEEIMGEELEGPAVSSDPEYIVENGVTTFVYEQSRKVIGAMTNSELPNLILFTTPTAVTTAGVEKVDNESIFGKIVDVYTVNGVRVRTQQPVDEALRGLEPGIYIVGGKKVLVK